MSFLDTFFKYSKQYFFPLLLITFIIMSFLGFVGCDNSYVLWILIAIPTILIIFTIRKISTKDIKISKYNISRIKSHLQGHDTYVRIFPVYLALCIAISIERISLSTQNLFLSGNRIGLTFDWPVALFWLLFLCWIILLPLVSTNAEKLNADRLVELTNSIHLSPSNILFKDYPELFRKTIKGLEDVESKEIVDEQESLKYQIQVILKSITTLTKQFSPLPNSIERIGANIWLIFNKRDQKIFETLPETISFNCTHVGDSIIGVTFSVENLVFVSDELVKSSFNSIILPIPIYSEKDNIQYALPGAPKAAIKGFSSYDNLEFISSELGDFKASTKAAMTDFFSSGTDNNTIKSFFSLRIGDEQKPIGILNVDSKDERILGDTQFLRTYLALAEPFIELLRSRVDRFSELFVEKGEFPWNN